MSEEPSSELVSEYKNWAAERFAPKTLDIYQRYVERLSEFCTAQGKEIELLQESDIADFAQGARHYKPATQDSIRHALESFYSFLIVTGKRTDSPIKRGQFVTRSRTKIDRRRPRPRQVSQKLAKLSARDRAMALLVSELLEKGATLHEIFGINEEPPVGHFVQVENGRGERRPMPISGYVRARLDEWGGHLPIAVRGFQRVVEKVGLHPKDLGDPSRPGLGDFHLTLLPEESVREELERRARPAFLRGEYDTAAFEAMKAVEIAVRKAGNFTSEEIGTALMRRAFDVESGPLRDPMIVRSERQATSDLFAGAIGLFKNPSSHRDVNLEDPVEVAGIIRLSDVLLRIIDRAAHG